MALFAAQIAFLSWLKGDMSILTGQPLPFAQAKQLPVADSQVPTWNQW